MISPHELRVLKNFYHKGVNYIYLKDSGWHFSYLGGIEKIIYKLKNAAHPEVDNSKLHDESYINSLINQGVCFHKDNFKLSKINNMSILPKAIQENPQKYQHLFYS